ncbi:MAG: hypothetical protein HW384_2007, partial [Dehalococcoidia bacterium]|nr:hypothetical protein [Dehalococcoidia bacterium]
EITKFFEQIFVLSRKGNVYRYADYKLNG